MSNPQEPPLQTAIAAYYGDPAGRMCFVRDMFNRTARHYDSANRLFSLGTGAWYRRACLRAGLRPGGTMVLLEISAPRKKLNRAIAAAYIGGLVPLLAMLTKRDARARTPMRYHWDTIVNYMPPEAVLEAMAQGGFESLDRWTELDLFHCFRGHKPQPPGFSRDI